MNGVCIVFSWFKNAVLLKKCVDPSCGFRETVSDIRAGPAGRAQDRERCRRGRRNVSAVCRPSTPDAIRRGLVQPLGAYLRPSGSLRCVKASVCACMTRLTGPFDALPVQNVQNGMTVK